MLDRSIAPPFVEPDIFPLLQAERFTLSNGQSCFVLRDEKHPVIRLEIIFQCGAWDQKVIGQSYFASKMLQEGTPSHSAAQIAEFVSSYGAFLEVTGGKDRIAVSLYSLKQFLKDVLPVVQDLIFHSNFPDQELDKLKSLALQNYRINQEKTSYLANQEFKKQLFGEEHPYSVPLSEAAISTIDKQDLIAFHQENILSKEVDYILTGNVSEEDVELIDSFFAKAPWQPRTDTVLSHEVKPQEPGKTWIPKQDSLQATVRVGRLMPKRDHVDFHAFSVLNEIFGGYFGSRLMSNIREDKGYTYGISSGYTGHSRQHYLVVGTDVKAEYAKDTLKEIQKEMNLLRNEGVAEEELSRVKNYMLGSFCSSISTIFDQAEKFKLIHYSGLDYTFYDDHLNTIKSITPEMIRSMAQTYLDPDHMIYVVAGTDAPSE